MVEGEGRRLKAEEVEEAVPGPKMAVGFSRTTSDRFGLGGGLPVDQCRFGCSMSHLMGSAVLRMQLKI